MLLRTHNLDSVDEIPVDVIAYLTDIIARILRLDARYYEIVAVQGIARIPAHNYVGCCQHIGSTSPQQYVISCCSSSSAVQTKSGAFYGGWKKETMMAIRDNVHRADILRLICLPAFST